MWIDRFLTLLDQSIALFELFVLLSVLVDLFPPTILCHITHEAIHRIRVTYFGVKVLNRLDFLLQNLLFHAFSSFALTI